MIRKYIKKYMSKHNMKEATYCILGGRSCECFPREDFFRVLSIVDGDGSDFDILCCFIDKLSEGDAFSFLRKKTPRLVWCKIDKSIKVGEVFRSFEREGYRLYGKSGGESLFVSTSKAEISPYYTGFVSDQIVKEKMGDGWRKLASLPENTRVAFVRLPPAYLLNAKRFDVALKAHYARLWLCQSAWEWREYVYLKHIESITNCYGIREYGNPEKESKERFFSVFHQLLGAEGVDGFPFVPVGKNDVLMDGGHRTSVALVKSCPINVCRVDTQAKNDASFSFFNNPYGRFLPCPEDVLDAGALEYIRYKSGVAIALVFPSVSSSDVAEKLLSEVADIVYKKKIQVDTDAANVILKHAYYGHEWMDEETNSDGFRDKVQKCFPRAGIMTVFLIDNFVPEDLARIKGEIRGAYKIGNHSIHISDSDEEAEILSKLFFNSNSLSLLRYIVRNSPEFHQKLWKLKDWADDNGADVDDFVVGGSGILGVLGLREIKDIDVLCRRGIVDRLEFPRGIGCHNHIADSSYPASVEDILDDPRLHAWYMGIKFCSPQVIIQMKRRRGEEKDKIDVLALERHTVKRDVFLRFFYKLRMLTIRAKVFAGRVKRKILRVLFK